ncbi:MAG: glycerol-3-phosphate 1-O-acyltransferase PlsY [Ruminococcaceae bacterium]|nr:glycerol-3-phosphate 1-O-acyltransferase PlsY [Oscillospiraceae bacterium]
MAYFLFSVAIIGSYLLGSINGAVVISKLIAKKDVRDYGSGNAGMTNMMRVMGFVPGLLTFIIDVLKGSITCLLARFLVFPYIFAQTGFEVFRPEYAAIYCGMFCLLGHIFPVFFGFKGGKGVATTLGIGFVCCWHVALLAFATFLIVMAVSRIVSLSSIIAGVSIPVFAAIFMTDAAGAPGSKWVQFGLITLVALNLIWMHRTNIVRLIKGEEKKLAVKKQKEQK